MRDELFYRFSIGHEGARLPLVPKPVGMPDAVGTIEWAALDVIQAQPAHRYSPTSLARCGRRLICLRLSSGTNVLIADLPSEAFQVLLSTGA